MELNNGKKEKNKICSNFSTDYRNFYSFDYFLKSKKFTKEKIISENDEKIIKEKLSNQTDGDIFYNIKYSGLDLAGNRYILRAEEAYSSKMNQENVNMKIVNGDFYFKDGTILKVESDTGMYNNSSLDMNFFGNVKVNYLNSDLFADNAEYSNSEGFLVITNNVEIKDERGVIFADKLFFDINKQTLNIASFKDGKVNANLDLK